MDVADEQRRASSDIGFRLACVGAALAVTAALVQAFRIFFMGDPGLGVRDVVAAVATVLAVAVVFGLKAYGAFCLRHGGCDVLAIAYGAFVLVVGTVAVVTAVAPGGDAGLKGSRPRASKGVGKSR